MPLLLTSPPLRKEVLLLVLPSALLVLEVLMPVLVAVLVLVLVLVLLVLEIVLLPVLQVLQVLLRVRVLWQRSRRRAGWSGRDLRANLGRCDLGR